MKPPAEALQQILDGARPLQEIESRPLSEALDRILASNLYSSIDVPPADNSAMDGFAFKYADHRNAGEQAFPISQRIAAGSAPPPLQTGTAARIFTGAGMPAGADTVVMQEQCRIRHQQVVIPAGIEQHNNVRPRGQDIARGSMVTAKGTALAAAHIGLLASVGVSRVDVLRPLRAALLATGDELQEPGEPLQPGQIYNSNRFMLSAMLRKMGVQVVDLGRVTDTRAATIEALEKATGKADVIISTGGVSVGEEDHVRDAVAQLGDIDLWKLAIKPGKPLAFGRVRQTPFIGLPGNPLSSFITFLFFARPCLQKMQGREPLLPHGVMQAATFDLRPNSRQQYLLVRASPQAPMQLFPNQSSGMLSSAAWANAVAIVPLQTAVARGDPLEVIYFNQLF